MGKRAGGGGDLSDHYTMMVKNGRMEAPAAPKLTTDAINVWNAFTNLHATRGSGRDDAPDPITYLEMTAFSARTGWELDPWEVEAIRGLDDAYFKARNA
jgi:hypothetical protein